MKFSNCEHWRGLVISIPGWKWERKRFVSCDRLPLTGHSSASFPSIFLCKLKPMASFSIYLTMRGKNNKRSRFLLAQGFFEYLLLNIYRILHGLLNLKYARRILLEHQTSPRLTLLTRSLLSVGWQLVDNTSLTTVNSVNFGWKFF